MKGDFSRISFDPANHFSRVLTQQGRVTLDADFNEQAEILLHTLRTMACDLFGPYGGPTNQGGFRLAWGGKPAKDLRLLIGAGHYYVNGILCECDGSDYAHQPDYVPIAATAGAEGDPLLEWLLKPAGTPIFWVYLDVWERHITSIEQDSIREVALGAGSPDTCTRSKVIWQVKALPWDEKWGKESQLKTACAVPLETLVRQNTPSMAAQLSAGAQIKDPCSIAPDAKYRGVENQLYRVEVHQGGSVDGPVAPTFKWSQNNGSVASRWLGTEKNDLLVGNARGFSAGCWVELSDDNLDMNGEPGVLVELSNVQGDRLSVDPASIPTSGLTAWSTLLKNPKVRRWDQSENDQTVLINGAISIVESTDESNPTWIDLEDGIQVWFESGGAYSSGDYWLIPARVASGSIEWKQNSTGGLLRGPMGIKHHYAPLGIIDAASSKSPTILGCFLCQAPLAPCPQLVQVLPPPPVPPGPKPPAPTPPALIPPTPAPSVPAPKVRAAIPPTKRKPARKTVGRGPQKTKSRRSEE